MQTYSYLYHSDALLQKNLSEDDLFQKAQAASSVLVQIFSGRADADFCLALAQQVKQLLPQAVIVGSSSVGEIFSGLVQSLSVQISVSLFESTRVDSVFISTESSPVDAAAVKAGFESCARTDNKALLLTATPITVDCDNVTAALASAFPQVSLMGGGAGDNGAMDVAYVFNDECVSDRAVLGAMLSGDKLSVISHAHLHWQPIGKIMTVTSADKKRLYTLDDEPAFDAYARYLNLQYAPENFFSECLEFPLLIHNNGNLLARVPVTCHADGSLEFISDIKVGDRVQIGFGNVDMITSTTDALVQKFSGYPLESIFVYSCGCRRFFLQNDTSLETEKLEKLAHTCGYFTVGEFYRDDQISDVLNLTLTAYGLTEQPMDAPLRPCSIDNQEVENIPGHDEADDKYHSKHLRILGKLSRFLNATTDELQYTIEQANVANQVKEQFLASISHELRTPLASMLGYAALMADGRIEGEEAKSAASIIIKNGEHVTSLIDDILEFSKVNSGQVKLVESELNLPSFIHSLQDMILPLIEGKNVSFSIDAQFPLPNQIKTDALRLRQILINLLNNSAKFTEYGQIVLQVAYDFEGQHLSLAVEDSGKGIKPEDLCQLFQPFEQLDVQLSRQFGGAGLGLSISRELALLLGGDIQVDSQEGVGSCFTCGIQAPITSADIIDDSAQWQKASKQERPFIAQQKQYALNVLLAEDHEQNRVIFTRMLSDLGCKVVAVENGVQALAAYDSGTFELILLDIQMPEMGGIETLKQLQARANTLPVVAITANVLRSDIEHYFSLGFSGHLAKPVSTIELTGLINNYAAVRPEAEIKTLHYADLDRQYLQSLPSVHRVMQHFFQQQLWASLADEAHKLKGSAVHFRHPQLEDVAVQVEVGIKQRDASYIAEALDDFDAYLQMSSMA